MGEPTVRFLGHTLSHNEIHPDPAKIEALKLCSAPCSQKQLRSFLGMVNFFYTAFLQNSSLVLCPLHRLLRKDVEWSWGELEEGDFREAKALLTEAPVLVPFDTTLPLSLVTDASLHGIGSVLEHVVTEGDAEVHMTIAFFSKSLNGATRTEGRNSTYVLQG